MRYFYILLLISIINFPSIAQEQNGSTDPRLVGIDSLLNKVLKDQLVAGFSVAVVDGNKVIYSKGFGYRDIENKKPVTANTLFGIGSSTKAFTAALLGVLQKEGKLSLDGNVVSYLPQFRFFNDNMNNQITIRDLMAHRTGLTRYDFSWRVFNTNNRDSMINRIRYMEPNAGLREKWQYNNFMYLVQAVVAEKITGKSWEQNIKDRFFLPLEMNRSNASLAEFQQDKDASLPYQLDGDRIEKMEYFDMEAMGPAGSINSSSNDMANWLKLWISGGYYKEKSLLPPDYINEAASAQMVIGGGLPGEDADIYMENYGLGWMVSSYRGHYRVEHGGNLNGFSASVAFFPSDKLGVVVLTNQNESKVPNIVLNSIADRFFKLNPINWNDRAVDATKREKERQDKNKKEANSKQILNTKPSHPLKEYTGVFTNPGYGPIDISLKNDALFAKMGKYTIWLKHNHYDVFEMREVNKDGKPDTAESNLRLNFFADSDGKIESLSGNFEPDLKPIIFTLKPKVINLDLKTLEKYTGDYMLGTVVAKVSVREKVLYILVPGQPEYETIALGDHTFKLKALNGFTARFELKDNKKAESFLMIQPNGTFKATRKNN